MRSRIGAAYRRPVPHPTLIAGIGFKRDGRMIMTPERPLKPLVEMPPKAYQIADFDAYERGCGRRWAMYTSSLACPFNCSLLH